MPKSTAVRLRRRGDEQVALVQVGVKDAVIERLGQEGADQVVGQVRPVEPGLVSAAGVGERQARRPIRASARGGVRRPRRPPARACSRRCAMISRAARRRRRPRGAGRVPAPATRDHRRGEGARLQPPRGRDAGLGRAAPPGAARRRRRPTAASMPGRSTLTATSRPSSRRARWAWAIEAAAIGLAELRRTWPRPAGRARSTSALGDLVRERRQAVLQMRQVVGELARRRCRPRVESNWPSLIATGPSRSRAPAPAARRAGPSDLAGRRTAAGTGASAAAPAGSSGSSSRGISASDADQHQRRAASRAQAAERQVMPRLDRPALVQGRDAAGEVGVADTRSNPASPIIAGKRLPGRGSGGCSRPGSGRLRVAGDQRADRRDHLEGIGVVEPAEAPAGRARELQAEEPAAGLAARGAPRRSARWDVGDVADAERDRCRRRREPSGQRQRSGVAARPVDLASRPPSTRGRGRPSASRR